MDLAAYLDRIAYRGRPRPDRETLTAIQHHHLMAIPYENLDVQLGRCQTTDPAAAFDKLVTRRRGGWCYEMNGVLGSALAEIGFSATRLATAVMRSAAGDANVGNHLVIRVDMEDGPLLADVGLGDGPFTPYPLVEGPFLDRGFEYRLERLGEGWWRLHNHALAIPPNFDFHIDKVDESLMAEKCAWLQTDPRSLFVQNLICQRFTQGGHVDLIGRVLRTYGPDGVTRRTLESADELVETLAEVFDLDEPAAAQLWPAIRARHEVVFAQAAGG